MFRIPLWCIFVGVFLLGGAAFQADSLCAQSKKELENKRKKLLSEIESTNKLLKKTTKDKSATYDRFVALQSQIQKRENLIATLNEEINELEDNIVRTTGVVSALSSDIEQRKIEYGQTIRAAYRFKMTSNPLLYVLSATSLNQSFRRVKFLARYNRFRKQQAEAIQFTRLILSKKLLSLEEDRAEKENLLLLQNGQRTKLTTELEDKDQLLESLKKDESTLKENLKKKQSDFEALNKEIERIIREEVRKQQEIAERARKKKLEEKAKLEAEALAMEKPRSNPSTSTGTATKPSASSKISESETNSSESSTIFTSSESTGFLAQRGKLPLPVADGFISRPFGMNPHPTIPSIQIPNNGIDIRTDDDSPAFAVLTGTVVGVSFVPGHDYMVILQHGNYYTVYSNLQQVTVKKGDKVNGKQILGKVSMNPISGTSELHFEIWLNKDRLNPTLWLRR